MKSIKLKSGTELPLMDLKGKAYLQVMWRIVWFREEHPDWSIETELLVDNEKYAVAKATIKNSEGRIISTGHKEESLADFKMGYREKAETGAIGRALAHITYGTQFEPDFDEEHRVVDSPVIVPNPHAPTNMQPGPEVGIQQDLPACDCGSMLKFSSKKSGRYPDGCWYCSNFKDTSSAHVEPMQPTEYEQIKKEMLLYALEQAERNRERE